MPNVQSEVDPGILEQAFVGVGCSTTSFMIGYVHATLIYDILFNEGYDPRLRVKSCPILKMPVMVSCIVIKEIFGHHQLRS